MLCWLWTRLDYIPIEHGLGGWVRVPILINGISLVINAIDVGHYIFGEREEVVKDLQTVSTYTQHLSKPE